MDELDAVTAFSRTLTYPNRRPKDAATLILVDRTGRTPKVLLGKRHHAHAFLPGKYVFPGGRVDLQDRFMPVAKPLDPHVEARLMQQVARPSQAKAQAFGLSAIRETFEEAGLLIGLRRADSPPTPPGTWTEFVKNGLYPDLSALHFIARAITPPRNSRRFDARFFTADASAIAHRVDGVVHDDAELVEMKWLPISETRDLDLSEITRIVLKEIESRISAGFQHELPVPFFRMLYCRFVRELL
jgi:8-oxo-dGTP pyrophosphatase MutT (NUDIX family)